MKRFRKRENEALITIYIRLNVLFKGDVKNKFVFLSTKSEARALKELGIITPSFTELPRCLNWYSLTDIGQKYFEACIKSMPHKTIKDFDNGLEDLIFDYDLYLNLKK